MIKIDTLIIIPARGGSKGIPRKNIKKLAGKPLIYYSIDVARLITSDENICVSTDDEEIIRYVEEYGLKVPFKRPDELATDFSTSNDVIIHALSYYENKGKSFDAVILLQPTSPFRKSEDIKRAVALYDNSVDMVASVRRAATNPYYNSFEENAEGFLMISKGEGKIERRQDAPDAWEFNGSIYVINPAALKKKGMKNFTKIKKTVMDEYHSIDLDTLFDWQIAEILLNEKNMNI
jgi:N-acylneuraminate cytidylyltransferase